MTTLIAQDEQPISRTYQYRKVMKPMLERKRRARINHCLDELKELLVGALQAEGESVSRLEKADVLELTVRHLHKLRRLQQLNENSASERFKAGFITCTNEVSKYMSNLGSGSTTSLDLNVSSRLLSHLDHCIHQIEAQAARDAVANSTNMIPNGPLSSSSSTASTIVLQNPMSMSMASQISPLHHHLAATAAAAAAASASSPASVNSSSYNSLSSSSSLSPITMHSAAHHNANNNNNNLSTRTSPNSNLLTTYTPPTSPISSSPINKLMYHPYAHAAAGHHHHHHHHHGQHLIAVGDSVVQVQQQQQRTLHKSPSPAHIQNTHSFSTSATSVNAGTGSSQQQMPLSLCTKPELRMDRNNNNNNNDDEPFDLSNSMWRPW